MTSCSVLNWSVHTESTVCAAHLASDESRDLVLWAAFAHYWACFIPILKVFSDTNESSWGTQLKILCGPLGTSILAPPTQTSLIAVPRPCCPCSPGWHTDKSGTKGCASLCTGALVLLPPPAHCRLLRPECSAFCCWQTDRMISAGL